MNSDYVTWSVRTGVSPLDIHLQQLRIFVENMLSTRALGLAPSLRKAATSSNFGMRSNDLASCAQINGRLSQLVAQSP